MAYVFDTSFIIALVMPDEKNSKVYKAYEPITQKEVEKYTPQLLWYEIANSFMNMIRRKRYAYEEFVHFFKLLKAFRLTTDFETGINYSQKLLRLSNAYNITSYDAAYLELAERKNAVLCTLDEGLINAAKKHGVTVIKGV
jgi:predicted nucleic acid-binding protein